MVSVAGLAASRAVGDHLTTQVAELVDERAAVNRAFFGAQATRIATLCGTTADRFAAGGRLIAIGTSASARSDVRHVTVEFLHPVIVGKRGLPAIGLAGTAQDVESQLAQLTRSDDMVITLDDGLAFTGYDGGRIAAEGRADHVINAPSQHIPRIQEAHATAYHVLRLLLH